MRVFEEKLKKGGGDEKNTHTRTESYRDWSMVFSFSLGRQAYGWYCTRPFSQECRGVRARGAKRKKKRTKTKTYIYYTWSACNTQVQPNSCCHVQPFQMESGNNAPALIHCQRSKAHGSGLWLVAARSDCDCRGVRREIESSSRHSAPVRHGVWTTSPGMPRSPIPGMHTWAGWMRKECGDNGRRGSFFDNKKQERLHTRFKNKVPWALQAAVN